MPKLRVISSAMGGNQETTDFLKPICERLGMEFVRMSEWPAHDIRWKRETWLQELQKSDIVVCAARHQLQSAKSAGRAVQAMSLGKAVIASPLPAYMDVIQPGVNGFIANNESEWEQALAKLQDPELRQEVGNRAAKSIAEFSMASIGAALSNLIKDQAVLNCAPPKVDIIIPTYKNLEHLKLCVDSVRKCTDWPHNIIVVASGGHQPTADWLAQQPDVIRVVSKDRWHFSKANNEGLKVSKEPYACLLNDDTVVGVGWLNALMHEAMKPGVGAVGPFSNCDLGWLHDEQILVGGRQLVPGMSMGDIEPILDQVRKHSHEKVVHERKWVAFYCTLMPRLAIEKVGALDEGFLSGDEDVDYCTRLLDNGYRIVQTFDSWVFHFGGKTRKTSEGENKNLHHDQDQANHAYFIKKWGVSPADLRFRNTLSRVEGKRVESPRPAPSDQRPLFGIYTGQAWEPWTPKSVDQGGIGGSETATVYMARDFARLGFRSVVFGDCHGQEGTYDGVEYLHYTRFDQFIALHDFDLFVSSRRADVFEKPIQAKKKVCMVHDIWLSPDQNANLWADRVDKFFTLSRWHRDFLLGHHRNVPKEKVVVTRNGIDLGRFSKQYPKERGRIVYSSSPDRGLDTLIQLLPQIRKEVPSASVHVFYGFDNWEKAIRTRQNRQEIEWMEGIKALLDQPGVVYRGRVGQAELAKEISKAELWAFPTRFTETFCITALENMAAGNPVICSDLAGLSSTVSEAGILIPGDAYAKKYQEQFIKECAEMLTIRDRWQMYSERGVARAKWYSWTGVAEEWLGLVGLPVPAK